MLRKPGTLKFSWDWAYNPLTESAALSGSPCNDCRFAHKSSWTITVPAGVLEQADRKPLLRQLASCRPPSLNAVNPLLASGGCSRCQSPRQIPDIRGSRESAQLNAVTCGRELGALCRQSQLPRPVIRYGDVNHIPSRTSTID